MYHNVHVDVYNIMHQSLNCDIHVHVYLHVVCMCLGVSNTLVLIWPARPIPPLLFIMLS